MLAVVGWRVLGFIMGIEYQLVRCYFSQMFTISPI